MPILLTFPPVPQPTRGRPQTGKSIYKIGISMDAIKDSSSTRRQKQTFNRVYCATKESGLFDWKTMQNHCFELQFTLLVDSLNINSANTPPRFYASQRAAHHRKDVYKIGISMDAIKDSYSTRRQIQTSNRVDRLTKGSGSTSSRCYPRRGRSLTVKSGNWEAGFIAKDLKGGGFLFLVKKSAARWLWLKIKI
jgi:hypothetical protein